MQILPNLRVYNSRVELLSGDGSHVRYPPGWQARELVTAGGASVAVGNGNIRAIKLTVSAETYAVKLGPATPVAGVPSTRFATHEWLNVPAILWRHHWRSTDYE